MFENAFISATAAGINPGRNLLPFDTDNNSTILEQLLIEANSTGKILFLDFPYAEFSKKVKVENLNKVKIIGLCKTDLAWYNGGAFELDEWTQQLVPSTLFHLINCRQLTFKDFNIRARHPLGRAFRSSTLRNKHLPSYNIKFNNIELDGINGALLQGVIADDPISPGNANNDLFRFEDVGVINLGHAQEQGLPYDGLRSVGFEFRHPSSMGHNFIGCNIDRSNHKLNWDQECYGVSGSSWYWLGGAFSRLTSCFLHESTVDPLWVGGVTQAEGCRALFKSTDVNPMSGLPVTIEGVRFATNLCEDGDIIISAMNNMQLSVRGVNIGGKYDLAIIPVRFNPGIPFGDSENSPTIEVNNSNFRTITPPEECIQTTALVRNIWGNRVELGTDAGSDRFVPIPTDIT